MHRTVRQLLLVAVLALYGSMTCCGPALHAFSFAGHGKAISLGGGDGTHQSAASHNDCPVCHFLAQGQLADESSHVPSLDVVLVRPVDRLPFAFPAPLDRPTSPRALPSPDPTWVPSGSPCARMRSA